MYKLTVEGIAPGDEVLAAEVMPGVDEDPVGPPAPVLAPGDELDALLGVWDRLLELAPGDELDALLGVWDGLPEFPPPGVLEGPPGCPFPDVCEVLPVFFEVESVLDEVVGRSGVDGPEVPLTLLVPL